MSSVPEYDELCILDDLGYFYLLFSRRNVSEGAYNLNTFLEEWYTKIHIRIP